MNQVFAKDDQAHIKKTLEQSLPKLKVLSIEPAPVKGLYIVMTDAGELLHVDAKAEYIFSGDLYRIAASGLENLSENSRGSFRSELVKSIDLNQAITYKPEGESRAEILVFTDTDCGYCRKMHAEVPALLQAGVTVHYLAWPRRGVRSNTGKIMTHIWCADDQRHAMDLVKTGRPLSEQKDCSTPIQSHLDLGLKMGVSGTPAVFTMDGKQLGGYVPASAVVEKMGL